MAPPVQSTTPLFRSVVPISPCGKKIYLSSTLLSTGSCFAENIGTNLENYKANICINPTGILYNPFSICNMLTRILECNQYSDNDLFEHEGLWRCFDHHSRFASPSKKDTLNTINTKIEQAFEILKNADFLLLTFGTSFVYSLKDSGMVVANCHKLPSNKFNRRLLAPHEIIESCKTILGKIQRLRPDLQVIITISPIRHLRESVHENCVSKSNLFSGVYELEKLIPELYYFPAYEIMMDELRDYRFYQKDMAHPNEEARQYIWLRFREACISESYNEFIDKFESIQRAMKHRIQNPSSDTTKKFVSKQNAIINQLEKDFPETDFSEEKAYFSLLCQS